jgi:hypothetical protein
MKADHGAFDKRVYGMGDKTRDIQGIWDCRYEYFSF